jgi:hypothetical protein
MLININIANTRPIKHIKNINKTKNKALVHIKKIIIRIYTIKDIYTKENTKKAKKIKDFNKRSIMFITNKAAS